MSERLSRQELYDLVWSEPIKNLAVRFGISDVALKKTCARASIPTPDRGYWAKKEAGKATIKVALPIRAPAMDDEVLVAGGNNYWYRTWSDEELLGPLPTAPEFPEPIAEVRERIVKAVGKISAPRMVGIWHPMIDRLLKEDEKRREKYRTGPYSWNEPKFDVPSEMRRLRLLNSLFLGAARMNGKPKISGQEARDIDISFYGHTIFITLDKPKESRRGSNPATKQKMQNDSILCLSIRTHYSSQDLSGTWSDDDNGRLETKLTEIVVDMVVAAENHYRESAIRQYEWRVNRKAAILEEQRQKQIEAECAERARQARLEQARVERLIKDAAAFQQAAEIRKYVEAIRSTVSVDQTAVAADFDRWSKWALAQAHRIDPSLEGRFLASMQDEQE